MAGPVPYAGSAEHQRSKKKKKKGSFLGSGGLFGGIANSGGGFLSQTPKQHAGSLAELIEKQAASQKRQAEAAAMANGGGVGDPYQNLQDQLFAAINGVQVAPTPLAELTKMAQQQVGAQFDPQIHALMAQMGVHENRAEKSQKTARDMYGGLSKDYLAELPALTQQFKSEDNATDARYNQAQGQMNDEYQKQAAQQNAVLKQLGISAAQGDSSQQARDDQAYFQGQMETDQQQARNALDEQQMAAQTYQRNMGDSAKMAGENTAQDIRGQLDDYLTQADSQVNSLQGQRSSAVAALISQMQSQDAQNAQTQSQNQVDNLMKMFNFQLAAQKASDSAAAKSSDTSSSPFGGGGISLTTGLEGASNYLANQYPDQPILAKNLMTQLNDVLSNKNVVQGKYVLDPGDPAMGKSPKYSDVGQEYMMDLLRREFEKEGNRYSSGDINSTMNALLAYLGKLR